MDRAVIEREGERRAAVRARASDLPETLTCRITPGRDVQVVDISSAGMLVESPSPLFPGRAVKLHLRIGTRRLTLDGTVVRGSMAAVHRDRGATFVSGIAFGQRVDLSE